MKSKKSVLFFILFLFFGGTVQAKDVYDIPSVRPILNPLYPSSSELSLGFAYFPIGAFNKHIGIGGSYQTFLTENSVWEVISAYYAVEMPSGLKNALIQSYGASESDFAVLQFMAKTGYSWSPFYTKSILFNSKLIHSRTFLNFSGGIAGYKIESPPLVSVGFGQNYYFGESSGLKFGVDYMHFFKNNKYIQDQLTINLGYLFMWGGDE